MAITTRILAVTLALGGSNDAARPQAVWQADVRVQSLTVAANAGQLSVRAVIHGDKHDAAGAARVEFLLPVGVGVLRVPAACQASASQVAGLHARVPCDLGDVEVRGTRELVVVTTGVSGSAKARFAAFVTSDTPDPASANNYAERSIP